MHKRSPKWYGIRDVMRRARIRQARDARRKAREARIEATKQETEKP